MGSRRKARECVLQMLYQYDLSGGEGIDSLVSNFWVCNDQPEDVRFFAEKLFSGIIEKLGEIDDRISGNSTNWKISRMAAVDKNILRLAVFELLYREDIPIKVTINEAVEIAKKFGTADSSAFVNGVLDNIAKSVEGKPCEE
jgi:N utilization substance protein B